MERMHADNSYQEREVRYEKIHSIDEHDFDALVSLVGVKNGDRVLDACCGYGAVSQRLVHHIAHEGGSRTPR